MTDEIQDMVECEISKQMVEKEKAIEYKLSETEDIHYVNVDTVFNLIQNSPLLNVLLEQFALRDNLYNEIVSVRKQAIATNKGVQEGATKAVKAVQNAAKELGIDIDEVLAKAFPTPPESPQEDLATAEDVTPKKTLENDSNLDQEAVQS